jgi:hypothetical protein
MELFGIYKAVVAQQLGYDLQALSSVKPQKIIRVWDRGTFKDFDDYSKARNYRVSTNGQAEEITVNQAEYDGAKSKLREVERVATDRFNADLRMEYSGVPDAVYAVMLSNAYDRGHSYGLDEVASYMIDEYESMEAYMQAFVEAGMMPQPQ